MEEISTDLIAELQARYSQIKIDRVRVALNVFIYASATVYIVKTNF